MQIRLKWTAQRIPCVSRNVSCKRIACLLSRTSSRTAMRCSGIGNAPGSNMRRTAMGQSLFIDQCTPSVGCAYDERTGASAGAFVDDDAPSHCGDQYSVVAGEFPTNPEFNGFDLDESCTGLGQRSLSPVLDQALRSQPLASLGASCRSRPRQLPGAGDGARLRQCARANWR